MEKTGFFTIIAMALLLVAALPCGSALAQTAAPSGPEPLCNATLWQQMTARATLLGQIDTATVQNLVYKPDSVLEYTCFNRFIGVATHNMPYYITTYYPQDIIQAGVTQYLYENFGHTYLGGRLNAPGEAVNIPDGTYVCNAMGWVWEAAKCINFAQTEPQDSIYDLTGFISAVDIRQLPKACTNTQSSARYGRIPAAADTISTGIYVPPLPDGYAPISENPPPMPDPSTPRPIICGTPIATGMVIDQPVNPGESRPQIYNEKICPNPVCNYTPSGLDSGSCAP